jgi:NADPH-dependent F420 reductase
MVIGVLGGTAPQGRGLAYRWALAGLTVVVGSREEARGAEVGSRLSELTGSSLVWGTDCASCAAKADIVVAAIPWEGHDDLLTALRSELETKIVVDCVHPLGFDGRGPYALGLDTSSAAEHAQAVLPKSRITAAFHNVSALLLEDPSVESVDTDVLVLGDDRDATDQVCALASAIPGVRGIFGGRLRNSGQIEALTANLIAINRRYKVHAGIRVTGL